MRMKERVLLLCVDMPIIGSDYKEIVTWFGTVAGRFTEEVIKRRLLWKSPYDAGEFILEQVNDYIDEILETDDQTQLVAYEFVLRNYEDVKLQMIENFTRLHQDALSHVVNHLESNVKLSFDEIRVEDKFGVLICNLRLDLDTLKETNRALYDRETLLYID